MSKALCTAPLWKHLAKRGVSFCVWAHSISRLFAFIYHGSFKYPWIPTCIYIGIWNFFSFSTFTQRSALPTSKDKRSVICGKRKSYLLVNSFRYLYTMGGFICTISLLISFQWHCKLVSSGISSQSIKDIWYVLTKTIISFEVQQNEPWTDNIQSFEMPF